mmetsp:Transcript_4176/g.5929  ORF Transcript_4176/g.5929 Transcript_4176/m.5929 type:complete len:95 (+) Transcript_4176:1154-1438(+)
MQSRCRRFPKGSPGKVFLTNGFWIPTFANEKPALQRSTHCAQNAPPAVQSTAPGSESMASAVQTISSEDETHSKFVEKILTVTSSETATQYRDN